MLQFKLRQGIGFGCEVKTRITQVIGGKVQGFG